MRNIKDNFFMILTDGRTEHLLSTRQTGKINLREIQRYKYANEENYERKNVNLLYCWI